MASGAACVQGADLTVVITAFSDSQTGAWTQGGCGQQSLTTQPATVGCAYSGDDNVLTVCADPAPVNVFPLLGGAGVGGTWTASDGSSFSGIFDRWGLKVFGADKLGEAWNGAMNNSGAVLPQDVYVWSLRVGNGVTADRKELRGNVTLLK